MSSHGRFWKTPMRQMIPMIPNDMIESFCASSSIFRCSGVRRSSTSCIMLKITPNSVCEPVATTIPEPRPGEPILDSQSRRWSGKHVPFRTNVPMYAMHVRSAISVPSGHGVTPFLRAVVSPVRLLSSTSRSTAVSKRTSAGMRSPVVKVTRSPGTTSFARGCICSPSRIM